MDPSSTTTTLLQQIFHLHGSVLSQKDLELQLRIQVQEQAIRIREQAHHRQAQVVELTRLQQQSLAQQEELHKQKLIIVQLKAEAHAQIVAVADCAVEAEWKEPATLADAEPRPPHSRRVLQHPRPVSKEKAVQDSSVARQAITNDTNVALVLTSPAPSGSFSSGGSATSMVSSSQMGMNAETIAKGSPKPWSGAATTCPIVVKEDRPFPVPTISVSSSSSTSSALSSSQMGCFISTKPVKSTTRTEPYSNEFSRAVEDSIFLAPAASSSLSPPCRMTSSSSH
jgi:hypothetical protein